MSDIRKPKVKRTKQLILSLLVLSVCLATRSFSQDSWQEQAKAAMQGVIDSGIPSVQVAVGYRGELVFDAADGLADVENSVAATPATMYRTASISKWMTATAAMALVEEGLLELDVAIQRYCPEYPEKKWPITTRQLLTHTAGIPHYPDYLAASANAATAEEKAELAKRETLRRLSMYTRHSDMLTPLAAFKDDPLLFEPGTAYNYSSFGYRVLGCVMDGIGGRSYRTIMDEEVFKPSDAAIIEDDAWAIVPHRATGYSLVGDSGIRRAEFRDVSENLPAGGHLATSRDLVRFALAFMDGDLIRNRTRDDMLRPYASKTGEPIQQSYAHGVSLMTLDGVQYLAHTGGQEGSSTALLIDLKTGLAFAIMSNVDNWNRLPTFGAQMLRLVRTGLGLGPR